VAYHLPGSCPACIDIPHLHQLVRQRRNSVRHAAQILGTSIEAVDSTWTNSPLPYF
jgi:hypothetical protein